MNNILVSADSRFPISRPKIKAALEKVLENRKIASKVEVSVLVCGSRKALDLAKKYLKDDKPHNVLSFVLQESSKGAPAYSSVNDESLIILGDIIVCYPIAQMEANRDNMLLDDKINELASHGLLHLLGEHHDDN